MCHHSQHTYLYAVVALKQLETENEVNEGDKTIREKRRRVERLRQELFQSVKDKYWLTMLHSLLILNSI